MLMGISVRRGRNRKPNGDSPLLMRHGSRPWSLVSMGSGERWQARPRRASGKAATPVGYTEGEMGHSDNRSNRSSL